MRLPNHKIQAEMSALKPFVNYNGTISAHQTSDIYAVWHWSTKIAEFNTATQKSNSYKLATSRKPRAH
jgi:glutamate synthase domain-containing protein 2